ncbi:DMT family transporter [Marivita hallyeonensis]|uniref:Permease of the drug/metabolite transporter (DMT) superfamily n=1 Tax=Marivita hallyeonensis TaxID=996342 RepID=A0A1M5R6C0_9RHOB|nr:DMT family transporter [Marivita hallyeonensis]SHH21935.1 Permease of the drug/metabolite transporter (DMT) superfamily [Marivita hallyeonensis]
MTPQTSLSSRAWAEMTLLGVIWGGSFLAIRTALDEIGPLTSVLHRTFWAMLVLWGVVSLRGLTIPRGPRIWGAFLVMGLLNNVIPFSLMAWGQLYIPTGLTSIFNAATAVFGVLVAAMVFADERLTPRKALGVSLGFCGVCLAIGLDALRQFDTTSLAQLAIVAGTVSYAFASAWARKMLGGVPPVIAAAGMLTGSSLVMIPLAISVEGAPTLALDLTTWAAIGYYAIIATAFAYLLYYRVLGMAGSGNLMLVTLLIPPVAITLGAIVRNETLHPGEYLGFAILALGLSIIDGRLWRRCATTV